MSQRHALWAFMIGCLIFLLTACAAGPSATQAPGASPTAAAPTATPQAPATTLPAGTVLYQASWSHGLSGWQGTHGWKVVNGQLVADSSGPNILAIPYRPTVSDYAVEVRLRVVRLLKPNGGYFTIAAPKTTGKDGYQAGVNNLLGIEPRPNGSHPQAQVFIDPSSSMAPGSALPIDYEPGSGWHIYRVEVLGNEARLLADGVQIGRASSEQTNVLSNGPINLSTALIVLRVSSVRVVAA